MIFGVWTQIIPSILTNYLPNEGTNKNKEQKSVSNNTKDCGESKNTEGVFSSPPPERSGYQGEQREYGGIAEMNRYLDALSSDEQEFFDSASQLLADEEPDLEPDPDRWNNPFRLRKLRLKYFDLIKFAASGVYSPSRVGLPEEVPPPRPGSDPHAVGQEVLQ